MELGSITAAGYSRREAGWCSVRLQVEWRIDTESRVGARRWGDALLRGLRCVTVVRMFR